MLCQWATIVSVIIALTILAIFVVLVGSEIFWRRHKVHRELSRKFVHLTVGTFVAFWPFFLSWDTIKLLSLAFLVVVAISKYLNIFQAIHSVQRPTWGEVFFALVVGVLAFVTQDKWIYAAALLQMSLADGMAAVVGSYFGRGHRYHVLGHVKSIPGTITFFVISFLILLAYSTFSGTQLILPTMLAISLCATLLENFAIHGFDNLLVPLLVAVALSLH